MQDDEEVEEMSRAPALDLDEDDDDDDDDEVYNNPEGGFTCHAVVADGLPKGPGIPTEVCCCQDFPVTCSIYSCLHPVQQRPNETLV